MMYGNGLLFPFNYVVHAAFLVSKCVSKKKQKHYPTNAPFENTFEYESIFLKRALSLGVKLVTINFIFLHPPLENNKSPNPRMNISRTV